MNAHAAIHVGCKFFKFDEDDRRDLYERVTGKRSLTEMSAAERETIVQELRQMGFKPSSKPARKSLEGKYAKKLQALWIGAWNLGVVRNKHDKALLAFVKRLTGIDHTRFLQYADDANKAIEAIKGMMAREGGVDWIISSYAFFPATCRTEGGKIAYAQWRKLRGKDASVKDFIMYCQNQQKKVIASFRPQDWIAVMNALGEQIRAAKKEQRDE